MTRLALEYALKVLSEDGRTSVLKFLETKCDLALYEDIGELSRREVDFSLRAFFGQGANILMQRFDSYLETQAEQRPAHTKE